MNFNISQIKDFLACPAKHHYRHVLRRGPTGTKPDSLILGTAVHQTMEAKLLGNPIPFLTNVLHDGTILSGSPLTEYNKLLPYLKRWAIPGDWEIIAVEQPMSVPFDSDALVGTLDAIVKWNGGFWSLQWKTCSAAVSLPSYSESVRVGWYECAYHWMAEQLGYTPFMGTILVTIKKLSGASLDRGTNPLALHYLPRSPEIVKKRISDLRGIISRLKSSAAEQNPDSCFLWNRRCDYFDVCHSHKDPMGPDFIDIQPRYQEPS